MDQKKNLLFIGDPNSIHDIKWMSFFSSNHNCYLIARDCHVKNPKDISSKLQEKSISFLGSIKDFSVFKPWKNTSSRIFLEEEILSKSIDIVHIFYVEPNILFAPIIKKTKTPIVVTTRGSDILVGISSFQKSKNPKNKLLIQKYKKAFMCCNEIISTSFKQKEFIQNLVERKAHIIRTGIDLKKIEQISLVPKNQDKYILFPRNMEPLYNHDLALDMIKSLSPQIKDTYRFVFVNKNSSNKTYVEHITNRLKEINTTIEFIDSLSGDDYYNMVYNASIVIMTPLSDGAPVSAMETLALKTPLILPDLDYDKDIFSNAHFYLQNDVKSLIKTTENVLSSALEAHSSASFYNLVSRNVQMNKVNKLYEQII